MHLDRTFTVKEKAFKWYNTSKKNNQPQNIKTCNRNYALLKREITNRIRDFL